MRATRVLVFLPWLTYGGAEKQGALLARHLQSDGFDVEVWGFPTRVPDTAFKRELDSRRIVSRELSRWPAFDWGSPRSSFSLLHLLRRRRSWPDQIAAFEARLPKAEFDIVVPFTFWPCLAAALVQRRLGARKILWNHRGGFYYEGISYTPFLVDQILQRQPVFVANSTAGGQFLRHVFSLQGDQVRIIRNAYAPEADEDARPSGERNSGVISLLHLANLWPYKDLETVLEAIRQFKAGGFRCTLHVAGRFMNAGHQKAIRKMVLSLDIEDCVRFHGAADRSVVHRLLAAADIGLLSSRSEGMPNSVMEYMYAGLPVLATDIPGVREVVGDDNTAWLFSPGDASALCDLIVRLARDRALRKDLGDANRRRIINEFGVDKIMRQWSEFLRGI
jgi:glycosyltransferase involved in cell wall biosynthesis